MFYFNKSTLQVSLLAVSLLMIASFPVESKIYKWTDENGKVHYSDKPIDDKSKQIKTDRHPSKKDVIQAKQRASSLIKHQNKVQEIAEEDARDKENAEIKAAKEKKAMNRVCFQLKDEMLLLGQGYATYITDDEGKRHFLSDEEKTKQIAKLKLAIEKNCK